MKRLHVASNGALSWTTLREYIERWTWPKSAPKVLTLFDVASIKKYLKNEAFSSSSSELLTLAPVLARFFATVGMAFTIAAGVCSSEVLSILAVLDVLDLLQTVKRNIVSPSQLHTAIRRHLDLFWEAYGEEHWRPKHHYALHLPRMLQFFGFLVACFTTERAHKLTKKYARVRLNTTSYEIGMCEEITVDQLETLMRVDFKPKGLGSHGSKPTRTALTALREVFPAVGDHEFQVAKAVKTSNGTIHVGDVVYFNGEQRRPQCGEVLMHVQAKDACYSVVSPWERDAREDGASSHTSRFRALDEPYLVKIDCLIASVIYSRAAEWATVLNTPELR